MKHKIALYGLLVTLATMLGSVAHAVVITGYDVTNASDSGTGNWSHVYTGTITPTGNPGYSNYTGGSGTMADGVIGTNASTTQLFCENTNCNGNSNITPAISVFLDDSYTLSSLSIFGGDHTGNSIPGAITGVDVTIGLTTVTIAGTQFGAPGSSGQLINDLITLTGTGLELIATNQVILSNFTYLEQGSTTRGRFSITELEFTGTTAAVPEPGTLAILGIGLAGLGLARRRKAA